MPRQERLDIKNINMDLILGLPGEGTAEVENTMAEIEKLAPENMTVHTLAIKRASRLREQLEDYDLAKAVLMEKLLDISASTAERMNLSPVLYVQTEKYAWQL